MQRKRIWIKRLGISRPQEITHVKEVCKKCFKILNVFPLSSFRKMKMGSLRQYHGNGTP